MNKSEFINYIAQRNALKNTEAEKIINIFTDAVASSLGEDKEISILGFGSFTISRVKAREGINPRTKESLKIEAFNQVRFKVGQKLKNACNPGKKEGVPNKAKAKTKK